jgi:enamine deaminase RidA (YjgF/YER057c/UK114 family)
MSDFHVCQQEGLDACRLSFGGWDEWFVTVRPGPGESAAGTVARLLRAAGGHGIEPCLLMAFGSDEAQARVDAQLVDWCAERLPRMWIRGPGTHATGFAGAQLIGVTGIRTDPVRVDGRVVGIAADTPAGRICLLGDLHAGAGLSSRGAQAAATFRQMEEGMLAAGLAMCDVVRTWLYVDEILEWYDEFNDIRTPFFRERGVFERLVPASTGIGAGNASGTAVAGAAFGWAPSGAGNAVVEVESPLQCSARDYGSSFSRAVEVQTPNCRRLIVSGTASIDSGGATAHVGDMDAQAELTMDVIGAILEARDMTFGDTTRAIVYATAPSGLEAYERWSRQRGLQLPHIATLTDICRDDLLFEVELDAAVPVRP